MDSNLTEAQRRLLVTVFERGAEHASQALSLWLGEPVRLSVSTVEELTLEEGIALLGPEDTLVAACSLELSGSLEGQLLLAFEDRDGLALADLLLKQPLGTTVAWGDLERSAACETANIVGCAYLNSLANHLPLAGSSESQDRGPATLSPSPPTFRHEFAASLLEFVLMDQAVNAERLLVIKSQFSTDRRALNWLLLFVPTCGSLTALSSAWSDGAYNR